MIVTHWKPALLATLLALGLVGCGNGDEQAADTKTPQPQEETATEPADETATQEQATTLQAPTTVAEPADAVAEGQDEGEPEEAPVVEEPPLEEGELGEGALPGEASREDVDAIIEETERRFQEAQQRIDEQFEQAGQEAAVPEPTQDDAFEDRIDIDSSLDHDSLVDEGSERLDVDAIIEEQERRFEEAQRELEQQFEEMEREVPESDGFDGGSTQHEATASDPENPVE